MVALDKMLEEKKKRNYILLCNYVLQISLTFSSKQNNNNKKKYIKEIKCIANLQIEHL